ncbi:MAG: energy-coupling factor ABC transporter ATP-binding protein [Verrucomicrobiales bacterium]|jgi:cobalt/nickel transport system ATP-binding protein|nr:energy-coupling factor ABC transporter ATP-binding protein [Verrucomicrobiales bacterium]
MSTLMLSLQNVSFAYPDGYQALDGVSFELAEGQTLGVVGANGAGKSTLLLTLPGVLSPSAGEIYVRGRRVEKSSLAEIQREVGLVFQDADDQLFTASVRDDVAFGARNMGLGDATVDEALTLTGIAHLAERAPYKLSGGEKKLAAIASVLSMRPSLLVMDEPSSSLDPKARRKIIELLSRLPQSKLIATHDLDLVWDMCDRVLVLRQGRVAADGDPRQILSDQNLLEKCGLELPLRFAERTP